MRTTLGDRLRESQIKPTQSFRCGHRGRMCVFIGVSDHTYMSIYIYTVFLKKVRPSPAVAGDHKFELTYFYFTVPHANFGSPNWLSTPAVPYKIKSRHLY
jgi:hypothetical protein